MSVNVVKIVKHGKYSKIGRIMGKKIKCPECTNSTYIMGLNCAFFEFQMLHEDTTLSKDKYFIKCKECKCEFIVNVGDKQNEPKLN